MSTKNDKQDGKIAEVFNNVLERGLVAGLADN